MNSKLILSEIKYAWKAFWSIISGFDQLQYQTGDGEWDWIRDGEYPDSPYYVCPRFYNGRHIPLPFFTDPEAQIGWLQLQAIRLAAKMNPGSYDAALEECAWYEHDFEIQ